MISDAEVAAVLPAKGWIADYMKFTAKALYAPRIFSLGMAHSLMLASTPFGHIRVGATKVSPTFFGLNIGSSGDGKTTAIDAGIDILGIENTAPSFASSNAFVEYLKVNPRTYISFGEFGRFLAETEDSVKTPLKTTFNDAFDGSPLANLLAGQVRNGNITKVTRYHLGIYGGVTPEYLARHTESVDWTSGFFARFGYFWGATPKSRPTQWDESLAGTLRGTLRALRDSADQFDGYPRLHRHRCGSAKALRRVRGGSAPDPRQGRGAVEACHDPRAEVLALLRPRFRWRSDAELEAHRAGGRAGD